MPLCQPWWQLENHYDAAKNRALQAQYCKAQELLNVESISTYLFAKDMLTVNEMEELANLYFTREKKINFLIRKFLTNKPDWWDNWLWCLHESSTQHGLSSHRTLAKLLEAELEQQLKEYKVGYSLVGIACWSFLRAL